MITGAELLRIERSGGSSGVAGIAGTKGGIRRLESPVLRVPAASRETLIALNRPLQIPGLDQRRGFGIRTRGRSGGKFGSTCLAPRKGQSDPAQQKTTAK